MSLVLISENEFVGNAAKKFMLDKKKPFKLFVTAERHYLNLNNIKSNNLLFIQGHDFQ